MSAQHTELPWKADTMEAGQGFMRRLASKEMHIVRQGPDVLAMVWAPDGQEEKDIACKMAAAEDLLESLKMVVDRGLPDRYQADAAIAERARAAIAKATGGTQWPT